MKNTGEAESLLLPSHFSILQKHLLILITLSKQKPRLTLR